jgi:hypothetical protein
MRLRDGVAALVGVAVLVAPAAAMGDALIGNYGSGNVQGANSNQSAINGSGSGEFVGPGIKFIEGNSTPNLTQTSLNAEDHSGLVGGGGGDGTIIGAATQQNEQGINSNQVAKKGTQHSTNISSGTQIIGLTAGDAIIGSPAQTSNQATNSVQTANSKPGAVVTAILGDVNKGPLLEDSLNLVTSCQVVIGGAAGVC